MKLGEKIYRLRTKKQLSQGELAELLEVSRQSISKWENNSAVPELEKMIRLSEIFEVSLDELVKGEEKIKEIPQEVRTEVVYEKPTGFSSRKIVGTILLYMQHKKTLIMASVLVVVLIGVGLVWIHNSQKDAPAIADYENQVKEYELSVQEAQAQLENLQSENQKLQAENSSILAELESQTLEWQELKNEIGHTYMGASDDQFLKEVYAGKYMTAENVPVRRMPSDNDIFYSPNMLSYYMVTPVAAVVNYVDDEVTYWVFVNFLTIGDMADNHGWVKFSELIEYTEDTKFLLKGPFRLSEDAVDIHTGNAVDIYLRGSEVNAEFEAGYVHVVTDSGISADVDKKYLIYPEVEYNEEKAKMETAQAIFDDIYPNYIEIRRLCYAGSVNVGDEVKDEKGFTYLYVEEDSYQDIDDIKSLMESVFSSNYIEQNLLHWVLQGESPLYKEINGKLCQLEADGPGIGASREIREILSFEENEITFTVENEEIIFKISLVKKDGSWRIDKIEEKG